MAILREEHQRATFPVIDVAFSELRILPGTRCHLSSTGKIFSPTLSKILVSHYYREGTLSYTFVSSNLPFCLFPPTHHSLFSLSFLFLRVSSFDAFEVAKRISWEVATS